MTPIKRQFYGHERRDFLLKMYENPLGGQDPSTPAEIAYSAPPDPLAGFRKQGILQEGIGKGRERNRGKGREKEGNRMVVNLVIRISLCLLYIYMVLMVFILFS